MSDGRLIRILRLHSTNHLVVDSPSPEQSKTTDGRDCTIWKIVTCCGENYWYNTRADAEIDLQAAYRWIDRCQDCRRYLLNRMMDAHLSELTHRHERET